MDEDIDYELEHLQKINKNKNINIIDNKSSPLFQ